MNITKGKLALGIIVVLVLCLLSGLGGAYAMGALSGVAAPGDPVAMGSSYTAGGVPYVGTDGITIGTDSDFAYDETENVLSVNGAVVHEAYPQLSYIGKEVNNYRYPETKAQVAFIFDDGMPSQWQYRDVFISRGIPVGLALMPTEMGVETYGEYKMSWDQARYLVREHGWEIANHSLTHASFDTLTEDEMRTEIYDSHKMFLDQGITPAPYYVYAHGAMGGSTGYTVVSELYNFAFRTGGTPGCIVPPANSSPFSLPRFSLSGGVSLAAVQTAINSAVTNNTGIILFTHGIFDVDIEDEPSGAMSLGKLIDILDYCDTNGIPIVTPSEVLRYSQYTRTSPPVEWPDQSFQNLLRNNSFEILNEGGTPRYWTLHSGITAERSSTQKYFGSYSAKIIATDTYATNLRQRVTSLQFKGQYVSFGSWVWSDTASTVTLSLMDSTSTFVTGAFHPGDSTWRWLTVTHLCDTTSTYVEARYYITPSTGGTSYVDGAMMVMGRSVPYSSARPIFDTDINSGTATVADSTTSIVVNHGLATTPTRVQITPTNNPTNAVSFWWVDTLTPTQFTINVNADPGASGLDFDWRAVVGEGN